MVCLCDIIPPPIKKSPPGTSGLCLSVVKEVIIKMKNLKIKVKLLTGFIIVIVLTIIVGIVGIVGLLTMNSSYSQSYIDTALPMPILANAITDFTSINLEIREAIIYADKPNELQGSLINVEDAISSFESHAKQYKETISNPDSQTSFDRGFDSYSNDYIPKFNEILFMIKEGDLTNASEKLLKLEETRFTVINSLSECLMSDAAEGEKSNAADTDRAHILLIILIAVTVITIIVSIILAIYLSRIISKPVVFMKDVLMRIGKMGDLVFSNEEYNQIEQYAAIKDEVGESVDMLLSTVRHLVDVKDTLEKVAEKNLTVELALLSDQDTMGLSLQNVVNSLSQIFGEINSSAEQVAVGSSQIASGAQSLAQGSTEQASVIEELSASISEMAQTIRENADMADRAAELADTIRSNAKNGEHQMNQMIGAIKEINQASQEISKVIKVIDEIAFQTNILALNAAVEAARAGQHGKGFAVVADEVRSLAAKSAEAAKDTSGLIANSIDKVELGVHIADETATSLSEIVSGITESSIIVGNIAKSSGEQAETISQINNGVDQVVQVIQTNSATAEQSAAASEELSGLANLLERLVLQFQIKNPDIREEVAIEDSSSKHMESEIF